MPRGAICSVIYIVYDLFDSELPVCVGTSYEVAKFLGIDQRQVAPRAFKSERRKHYDPDEAYVTEKNRYIIRRFK